MRFFIAVIFVIALIASSASVAMATPEPPPILCTTNICRDH